MVSPMSYSSQKINNTDTAISPRNEDTLLTSFNKEKKQVSQFSVCLLDRIQRQSCKTEDRVLNDDLSVYR